MLKAYLQQKQKTLQEQQTDFYTSTGIHVFFKDPIENDSVDVEKIIHQIEEMMPSHLLEEVEMIIIGWFNEFEERGINAFYESGALYVSNVQDDNADMLDDIIHEISHSVEESYGLLIYGDKQVEEEFLRKRKYLYDILWKMGYKEPLSGFMDPEYDPEFDMLLYQKIGYGKLINVMTGIFVTPYAATSLREYYATGFSEFYLHPETRDFLQKISPQLYKKIILLQNPEELDK